MGPSPRLRTRHRGRHDSARRREGQMRRTTPDLVGRRKKVFDRISIGLLVLTVLYVLWANYVVFVGGNLPLTSISLGQGSTGAGLTMLFIGDFIAVLAIWFVIDGVLLTLLHMVLRRGKPNTQTPIPPRDQQTGAQPQQWQPQQQQPQQQQPQAQPQWQQQPQQQAQPQWQQQPPQWQPQAQQ